MAEFPPQLAGESAKAYEAARVYFRMDANRSTAKVGQELGKTKDLMDRWSSQHDWVERSREYDQALAQEAAAAHTQKYLADLEAHRTRASEAGKALYSVAGKLLQQLNAALANPKRIKGEDGKVYVLHNIELNAATFATAARAMQTSLDLEAHALGIDKLLPSLDTDDSE